MAGIRPLRRSRLASPLPRPSRAVTEIFRSSMGSSILSNEERRDGVAVVNASNRLAEQASDRDGLDLLAGGGCRREWNRVRDDDFLERRILDALHGGTAEHAVSRAGD